MNNGNNFPESESALRQFGPDCTLIVYFPKSDFQVLGIVSLSLSAGEQMISKFCSEIKRANRKRKRIRNRAEDQNWKHRIHLESPTPKNVAECARIQSGEIG